MNHPRNTVPAMAGFGMDIAYSARAPKPEGAGWDYIPDPVALAARSGFLFVTLAANAAKAQKEARDAPDDAPSFTEIVLDVKPAA